MHRHMLGERPDRQGREIGQAADDHDHADQKPTKSGLSSAASRPRLHVAWPPETRPGPARERSPESGRRPCPAPGSDCRTANSFSPANPLPLVSPPRRRRTGPRSTRAGRVAHPARPAGDHHRGRRQDENAERAASKASIVSLTSAPRSCCRHTPACGRSSARP